MERPIEKICYLNALISEYIYYSSAPQIPEATIKVTQKPDENTPVFLKKDVEFIVNKYFKGSNRKKTMDEILIMAKEYGFDGDYIPEEVLFNGQGRIPYYLGIISEKQKKVFDSWQKEDF